MYLKLLKDLKKEKWDGREDDKHFSPCFGEGRKEKKALRKRTTS
jgi:hypothetical protein